MSNFIYTYDMDGAISGQGLVSNIHGLENNYRHDKFKKLVLLVVVDLLYVGPSYMLAKVRIQPF
jgi:hypothetical protein